MGYPSRSGFKAWGKVWSMGSKSQQDIQHGHFLQFSVTVPSFANFGRMRSRIWVHYFDPLFEPLPGQYIEATGILGGYWIQSYIKAEPRLNVVIMAWGKDVRALTPEDLPHLTRTKSLAKLMGSPTL